LKLIILKGLKVFGILLGIVILVIVVEYGWKLMIGVMFLACIAITDIFNDNLSKAEIFDLVNANYSIILRDVENNNFDKTLKIKGIEDVSEETEKIIEFNCGTDGFSSEITDYGFYYTSDDLPYALVFISTNHVREELVNEGNGYVARQKDGDDYYYTEKIRDNFYYYETHY